MAETSPIASLSTKEQVTRQRAADELLIAAIFAEAEQPVGTPEHGARSRTARGIGESEAAGAPVAC